MIHNHNKVFIRGDIGLTSNHCLHWGSSKYVPDTRMLTAVSVNKFLETQHVIDNNKSCSPFQWSFVHHNVKEFRTRELYEFIVVHSTWT